MADQSGPPVGVEGASPDPAMMYVHFLTSDHSAGEGVYLFQIPRSPDLPKEIQRAVSAIARGRATPVSESLEAVEWRAYSYLVFALLHQGGEADRSMTIDIGRPEHGDNNTFVNRTSLSFANISVVHFLNVRRNRNGHALGAGEEDHFTWRSEHRDHNGSGTNVGP